jgi:hypothetical protein
VAVISNMTIASFENILSDLQKNDKLNRAI